MKKQSLNRRQLHKKLNGNLAQIEAMKKVWFLQEISEKAIEDKESSVQDAIATRSIDPSTSNQHKTIEGRNREAFNRKRRCYTSHFKLTKENLLKESTTKLREKIQTEKNLREDAIQEVNQRNSNEIKVLQENL